MFMHNLIALVIYLLPLAALWLLILVGLPRLAQSRRCQASWRVHDNLMDAVLGGSVDRNDPRVRAVFQACELFGGDHRPSALAVAEAQVRLRAFSAEADRALVGASAGDQALAEAEKEALKLCEGFLKPSWRFF